MENEIRTFIAIELDVKIRERLKEIQDQLQQLGADVKWVEPENIHITLRFLGNLNSKRLKDITTGLPDFIKGTPPFLIGITGLGAFPNPQKPKVIWAGVSENNGELSHLAEKIENGINQCGVGKEDREFSSHITIGRMRSFKNISRLAESIPSYAISPTLEQTVNRVTLLKSTLTSDGPIYEPLLRVDLQ